MKFARPLSSDLISTIYPKLNEILLHWRQFNIRSTWIAYQKQIYKFRENKDTNFEKIH